MQYNEWITWWQKMACRGRIAEKQKAGGGKWLAEGGKAVDRKLMINCPEEFKKILIKLY
jgi:hypothetical protein